MNKAELIEVVAARIDASKKDAAEAVQAVVDAITEAVAKGQKVSISGFGVFEKAARPARTYRTPSTGEAIQKLATAVPKFRPGGDFRAFVAGDKNVSDIARRAQAAGDDVMSQASEVVRRVTRKPAAKASEAAEAAASSAPAKKATATAKKASTASKATATKAASTAKSTTAGAKKTTSTAAKKTTAAAKKAPAATPRKRATAKKAVPAAPETPAESPE